MGKNQNNKQKNKDAGIRWMEILPLLLMVTVQPLTVIGKKVAVYLGEYSWFPSAEYQYDFFMYGKMVVFLILTVWSLVILADRCLIGRKKLILEKKWLVLGIYGLFVVISTFASIDHNLSLKGMWEQYETVWILLGYLLAAFASLQLLQGEKTQHMMIAALCVGAGVEAIIGVFQMAGLDIWSSAPGKALITAGIEKSVRDTLHFTGGKKHTVYMSLYNPNYAGVYIILAFPLVLAALMLAKKAWQKLAAAVIAVLLLICLIGSGSKTGLLVLLLTGIVTGLAMLPGRKKAIGILLCVALAGTAWIAAGDSGRAYLKRSLKRTITKVENYRFQDIHADGQQVYLKYQDEEIWLDIVEEDGEPVLIAMDADGMLLPTEWDEQEQYWKIPQKPFRKCLFTITEQDGIYLLCLNKSRVEWNFAKTGLDGDYTYITGFGKAGTIEEAPAVLKGYERALSGRGYIWGRTIPLLSEHILLGTGPDTFIEAFPQNDYVKRYNTSNVMYREIPSKAHSMYLQSALQTGVLSMICLVVFWFWYLKDSFSLYLIQKKRDWIGLACAVSVTGYLLMGLMNDSNLATAPVFWCILGLGLAVNHGQEEIGK